MYRIASGMWHEAGLHLAMPMVAVLCVILAGCSGPFGPIKAYADTPLSNSTFIDNGSDTSGLPALDHSAGYNIFGYVFDSKGNKIPNAHVVLYFDDSSSLPASPTFSGDGDGDDPGYYGFSVSGLGNYTIKAEVVDVLGNVYNGTTQVNKQNDWLAEANVTITGYVLSPWTMATPTPTPTAIPILIEKEMPSATPLPATGESGVGGINTLYALAVPPVAIIGALMFMRYKKRPVSTNSGSKYVDARRSRGVLGTVNAGQSWYANAIGTPGLSEYFLTNAEYSFELEELIHDKIKNHYNDIAMIHRVEKMAGKYGIDQFIIYGDIRRIKVLMQRGRYK